MEDANTAIKTLLDALSRKRTVRKNNWRGKGNNINLRVKDNILIIKFHSIGYTLNWGEWKVDDLME